MCQSVFGVPQISYIFIPWAHVLKPNLLIRTEQGGGGSRESERKCVCVYEREREGIETRKQAQDREGGKGFPH